MAAKSVVVVPPASPFAALLRRSRFASYDPAIAQTYTAPPASARRGNYGLKRAIPMPYKDSYISVATFEHHAHFTDWNNAEKQVKFVRQLEEMNVLPEPHHNSNWDRALGDAQNQWLIDSEFAPSEVPTRPSLAGASTAAPQRKMDDLSSFGKQGSSAYGSRRPLPTFNDAQLNFESLSPKQFQRYLSQLRKLRTQFRAYLEEQYASRYIAQRKAAAMEKGEPEPSQEELERGLRKTDESLLFAAAQSPVHKLHRQFLTKQFSENYLKDTSSTTASSRIKAQPHRVGGLVYTHPSMLQSILTSSPLPGIVLQDVPTTAFQFAKERSDFMKKRMQTDSLVLFGDFLAKLPLRYAKPLAPLYHPDTPLGVDIGDPLSSTTINDDGSIATNTSTPPPGLESSTFVGRFRIYKIFLKQLPKVVSYKIHRQRPLELLKETSILAEVVPDKPWTGRNLNNPHKPGSAEYIAHVSTKSSSKHALMPAGYRSEMAAVGGGNGYGYGGRGGSSSFERKRILQQERLNRANVMRTVQATTAAAAAAGDGNNNNEMKTQINNLGMGMGMGMGVGDVDADARARMVSTLNDIVKRQDEDLDEDEEELY